MPKATKRYGRGLNSFVYRPSGQAKPVKVQAKLTNLRQRHPSDPERYLVSGRVTGEFQVKDLDTGEIMASQLDSRLEAESWVKDHCASFAQS